jgi:hypothetical protein
MQAVRIDRALFDLLDRLHEGRGRQWIRETLADDATGGRSGESIVALSDENELTVVVDVISRTGIRLHQGFIGSGWRIRGDRLWTDEWPFGHAIGVGLPGKRVSRLIDFEPLAQRRMLSLLGGPSPYGVIFEKDLVELDIRPIHVP